MGHHYVPQEYLRGFEVPDEPGLIWMYDKVSRLFSKLPIETVVQEVGYYDGDTERELSETVEGPANSVLAKLRRREPLSSDDRSHLALYLAVMIMRVPRARRRAKDLLPDAVDSVIRKVQVRIEEWAQNPRTDQTLVARRRAELEPMREKVLAEPPAEIVARIRAPWPSDQMLAFVRAMTWRVVVSDRSGHFLTTDNPAFFFEAQGIAREESEITFPLASDLALLASWQGEPESLIIVQAKSSHVKEVNRRVASGAERFVFYHEREDWIATLANKARPRLSRIKW